MALEIVPEREPVPQRRTVAFMGAEFAVADKIGLMPLLKFAKIAKSGVDSSDEEGMTAMYNLLQQCIADDQWDAFEDHANTTRADDQELLQVIKDVMTIVSERPTSRPSDSSAGPPTTAPISAEDSSSLEVVRRLKSQGRPDLAMAILHKATG